MTQEQTRQNILQIPRPTIEGLEMPVQRYDRGLQQLKEQGLRAAFLPEIAAARVLAHKQGDDCPWRRYFDSGSLRAFRTLSSGYSIVAIVHHQNYITENPEILAEAIEKNKLVGGFLELPEKEFDRCASRGELIDYSKKRRQPLHNKVPISEALDDEEVQKIFGGYENAKAYFDAFREVYGTDSVGIWLQAPAHNNPLGRLLYVGSNDNIGLNGYNGLGNNARFVGVRGGAEGAGRKISDDSLEIKIESSAEDLSRLHLGSAQKVRKET